MKVLAIIILCIEVIHLLYEAYRGKSFESYKNHVSKLNHNLSDDSSFSIKNRKISVTIALILSGFVRVSIIILLFTLLTFL